MTIVQSLNNGAESLQPTNSFIDKKKDGSTRFIVHRNTIMVVAAIATHFLTGLVNAAEKVKI